MLMRPDPLLAALTRHAAPPAAVAVACPKLWFWIVDELGPPQEKLILISDIQEAVAKFYGFTRNDILSDRRTKAEALARHVAMYLCRTLTRRSYEKIAHQFNRSCHSISIRSVKHIARLVKTDSDLLDDINEITRALR